MDTTASPYALYPGDINHRVKDGAAFVHRFVFINYVDSEDRCRIVDRDGRDVFNVRGSNDYAPVVIEPACNIPFWDMLLLELGSGQCYVYIQ